MRRCSFAFTAITLTALLLVCAGCAVGGFARSAGGATSAPAPVATLTSGTVQGTVQDYATLIAALTAAGATAQPGQDHPPSIPFDASSRELWVNGSAYLSVYEYPTAAAALAEASCFHGGQKRCPGASANTIIDYLAPPHLYLAGRILVLYAGTDSTTLQLLASVLGPPVDEGHWG
jgi:hypothetical protein